IAAAVVYRIKANGTWRYEPVGEFNQELNQFVALPIDLGAPDDQVFLILFGSGLRGRSALSAVTATVGGTSSAVSYAGLQGLGGVDQINLLLPASLAGWHGVDVKINVDGLGGKTVKVNVKWLPRIEDRQMKVCLQIIIIAFATTCAVSPFLPPAQSQATALVFSKTTGFRHDSIPDGIAAIRQLGQQNNFNVDATEDASLFTDSNLSRYQTVIFLNTTGDVLDNEQQAAFERYLRNGGGFVGVHSATDTEYDWAWYGGLVGAYFQSHPMIQPAKIVVEDGSHPSTTTLPVEWRRTDEWYNFRSNPRGRVKVLATLDETTYSGGAMGADHPIAWCQLYDGGRAWCTAGGHTRGRYAEPLVRQPLPGGIQFTAKIKDGACSVLAAASAASFRTNAVARESIASIFGSSLSTETQAAAAIPLPTTLANTSVRVRDGAGNESLAPLFFVSPA